MESDNINKNLSLLMFSICVVGLFLAPAYATTEQNNTTMHNQRISIDLGYPGPNHTMVRPTVYLGFGHSGTWYIDGTIYYGDNNSFEYHDTGAIIPIDPSYDGDAVGFDFYKSCDLVGTANY